MLEGPEGRLVGGENAKNFTPIGGYMQHGNASLRAGQKGTGEHLGVSASLKRYTRERVHAQSANFAINVCAVPEAAQRVGGSLVAISPVEGIPGEQTNIAIDNTACRR